jgi:hypothetical protein
MIICRRAAVTVGMFGAVVAAWGGAGAQDVIPLKQAKLIVEHNATDGDTGFQGFVDTDGWERLVVAGPDGDTLTLEAQGALAELGLTEIFFETVEPANDDISIEEVLAMLPEGRYRIEGPAVEAGERKGTASGIAWLTHAIPAGPTLLSPAPGATVPTTGLVVNWDPVTETIDGGGATIVSYQLIVEKEEAPHPHMIGRRGLSMYLPASVTSIAIPDGLLEPGSDYSWEVLAIEESGNQTISASSFSTE